MWPLGSFLDQRLHIEQREHELLSFYFYVSSCFTDEKPHLLVNSSSWFFLKKFNYKGVFEPSINSVFDNVIAGIFQIIFRVKIYVNDVFLFFKN